MPYMNRGSQATCIGNCIPSSQRVGEWIAHLLVLMVLCIPAPSIYAAQLAPKQEAAAFANNLRAAKNAEQASNVITQILKRIGVPVYKVNTIPLQAGSMDGKPHGLFDVEVYLVAKAFTEGELLSLDDLVTRWSEGGLLDETEGAKCSGAILEDALRGLRSQAEARPSDPTGMLIRLVDTLGKRNEKPFSLLGAPDKKCLKEWDTQLYMGGASTPAATQSKTQQKAGAGKNAPKAGVPGAASSPDLSGFLQGLMNEEITKALAEAEAEGDEDTAKMMQQMLAGGAMQQLLPGLAQGKTPSANDPAMQDLIKLGSGQVPTNLPSDQALEQSMTQARQAAIGAYGQMPSDASPEEKAYMRATQDTLNATMTQGGNQSETGATGRALILEQSRTQLEMTRAQNMEAEAANKQRLTVDDADATRWVEHYYGVIWAQSDVEVLENSHREKEYELELRDRIEENEPPTEGDAMVSGLYIPQEERHDSCLFLDPVQALLITLDLIGLSQGSIEGGVSAW